MPSASQASRLVGGRQLLGIEAALGAGRDDHRILDQLRLHQAEDLGAEVVAAVGPAQAAASDRAAAQVDAFDARAVDPDLAPRHRPREAGDQRGVDLERQRFVGLLRRRRWCAAIASTSARSRRRMRSSSIERTAASASSNCSRSLSTSSPRASRLAAGSWSAREQADQRRRRLGRAAQRIDDGDEAEGASGLAQITEPGRSQTTGCVSRPANSTSWLNSSSSASPLKHAGDRALDFGRRAPGSHRSPLRRELEQEIVDVAQRRHRPRSAFPRARGSRNSRAPERLRTAGSGRPGDRS